MYLCVYLCAYMYTWVQLPEEARKGLGTSWSWGCRQLWAAWHEHRETNYSSEFQRWMGAISPTPKAFFLMVETLWSILQTPYIFQNKTWGWDSQYILLFAFCFLFLVSPFADFIPGEFHPRMQWNMIISAPPHLSLQLPFSPSHHISLPTSYTLSKTFSADHMWMGVRQTPGARETPPNKEWYSPSPSSCQLPIAPSLGAGPWVLLPTPCWTISWLHVVQVLCRCAHEHKTIF